ncbi:hypothetical protein ACOME3_003062 [Neoechinorhynchus agilis]
MAHLSKVTLAISKILNAFQQHSYRVLRPLHLTLAPIRIMFNCIWLVFLLKPLCEYMRSTSDSIVTQEDKVFFISNYFIPGYLIYLSAIFSIAPYLCYKKIPATAYAICASTLTFEAAMMMWMWSSNLNRGKVTMCVFATTVLHYAEAGAFLFGQWIRQQKESLEELVEDDDDIQEKEEVRVVIVD